MCSVYLAHLPPHGTVVIKKPSKRSNETLEEIERELDIEKAYLARLHHPHIIRLIGDGRRSIKNNFEPFLVLEYLAGNTLGHLISERRRGELELPHFVLDGKKSYIPWAQAMGWAQDMASALHYMHHEASKTYMYICRDLKPDNIGFTADGTLKIFDFGLAKRVARKSGSDEQYTMTSRTGTIRYMAPEAFLGCRYNEKVDVYAWSHVVAEMLSLEVPYDHMGTQEFRETVALGKRRPHVEGRWPRRITGLLRRCWHRDPCRRPSFQEVLECGVLEEAAGPQHSWFHHFSRVWPAIGDGGRPTNAAAAAGSPVLNGGLTPAAAVAPTRTRRRIATIDAGNPNHRDSVAAHLHDSWTSGTTEATESEVMESEAAESVATGAEAVEPVAVAAPAAPVATVETSTKSAPPSADEDAGTAMAAGDPRHGWKSHFRLGPLELPLCFFGGGTRA